MHTQKTPQISLKINTANIQDQQIYYKQNNHIFYYLNKYS